MITWPVRPPPPANLIRITPLPFVLALRQNLEMDTHITAIYHTTTPLERTSVIVEGWGRACSEDVGVRRGGRPSVTFRTCLPPPRLRNKMETEASGSGRALEGQ